MSDARDDLPGTTFDVLTRADAQSYAAAVRGHLSDLSPEELDELTGGLEADLAELAAESATPLAARLGDPRAYAAELRSSAGLASKTRAARALSRFGRPAAPDGPSVSLPFAHEASRLRGWLATQSWWPQVRDFAIALRPAWWVLRAWIAFTMLSYVLSLGPIDVLPDTLGGWVALVGLVIVSVQLGRTQRDQPSWLRAAVVLGNAAAVLLLPTATAQASSYWMAYEPQATSSPSGLFLDGEPVLNLFPYGADGQPLTGVQLFDANGRPITLAERVDYSGSVGRPFAPYTDAAGHRVWNAFPLFAGRFDARDESYRPGSVRVPTVPFLMAPAVSPPLVPAESTPTPTTTSPTPTPTTTSPTPTATTSEPSTATPPPTTPAPSGTPSPTPS